MSGNAAFRSNVDRSKTRRLVKAACWSWLLALPDVACGQSLLCQHESSSLNDITEAPAVRACSLLQGHSRRGTWTAREQETKVVGAAATSGDSAHSGDEAVRHSISSIPQSIAVWVNTMFSSLVVANWTAGAGLQSSSAHGRAAKLMQASNPILAPQDDYDDDDDDDLGDMDDGSASGMVIDRDAWEGPSQNGKKIPNDLLPLQLHMQGVSLDSLMDRITETHSIFLRYYNTGKASASFAAQPGIIKGDSIAQLVEALKSEFSKACHLPENMFLMSSVHGRFLRQEGVSQFLLNSTSNVAALLQGRQAKLQTPGGSDLVSVVEDPKQRIAEEVVVRFFVLGNNSVVQQATDELRTELVDKNSMLMRGNLSSLLQRAYLQVGDESDFMLGQNHVKGIEALAMPVVVSVIFMMLLMWLSSV